MNINYIDLETRSCKHGNELSDCMNVGDILTTLGTVNFPRWHLLTGKC
jgi:hypothetical protein